MSRRLSIVCRVLSAPEAPSRRSAHGIRSGSDLGPALANSLVNHSLCIPGRCFAGPAPRSLQRRPEFLPGPRFAHGPEEL